MNWTVRRASPHDKTALAELCTAAVGPDDYVLDVLDRAIVRQVVHVAVDPSGRLVGMTACRPAIDGSAWLSMARTHPDFRRQGVARAILESFAVSGRMGSRTALRLWSEATNPDGNAAANGAGFREVARFARLIADAAAGPTRADARSFREELWAEIAKSPILARGRGYVFHDQCVVAANRPTVFAIAAKGNFRGWDGNVLTVEEGDSNGVLNFSLWTGRPDELLAEGCRQGTRAGRDEVCTFLPKDRDLLSEARRAGFREGAWGREAIVYELSLTPATLRGRVRPTFGELAARRGHGHAHDKDALGWARWNP